MKREPETTVPKGLNDLRVFCQPQIIVRAEHDAALALHNDLGSLPRFQGMEIGVDAHRAVVIGEGIFFAFFKDVLMLHVLQSSSQI